MPTSYPLLDEDSGIPLANENGPMAFSDACPDDCGCDCPELPGPCPGVIKATLSGVGLSLQVNSGKIGYFIACGYDGIEYYRSDIWMMHNAGVLGDSIEKVVLLYPSGLFGSANTWTGYLLLETFKLLWGENVGNFPLRVTVRRIAHTDPDHPDTWEGVIDVFGGLVFEYTTTCNKRCLRHHSLGRTEIFNGRSGTNANCLATAVINPVAVPDPEDGRDPNACGEHYTGNVRAGAGPTYYIWDDSGGSGTITLDSCPTFAAKINPGFGCCDTLVFNFAPCLWPSVELKRDRGSRDPGWLGTIVPKKTPWGATSPFTYIALTWSETDKLWFIGVPLDWNSGCPGIWNECCFNTLFYETRDDRAKFNCIECQGATYTIFGDDGQPHVSVCEHHNCDFVFGDLGAVVTFYAEPDPIHPLCPPTDPSAWKATDWYGPFWTDAPGVTSVDEQDCDVLPCPDDCLGCCPTIRATFIAPGPGAGGATTMDFIRQPGFCTWIASVSSPSLKMICDNGKAVIEWTDGGQSAHWEGPYLAAAGVATCPDLDATHWTKTDDDTGLFGELANLQCIAGNCDQCCADYVITFWLYTNNDDPPVVMEDEHMQGGSGCSWADVMSSDLGSMWYNTPDDVTLYDSGYPSYKFVIRHNYGGGVYGWVADAVNGCPPADPTLWSFYGTVPAPYSQILIVAVTRSNCPAGFLGLARPMMAASLTDAAMTPHRGLPMYALHSIARGRDPRRNPHPAVSGGGCVSCENSRQTLRQLPATEL